MPVRLDNEHDARPIVLIGFAATGKTTVGRILAVALGRPFIDLDKLVEETAGMSVANIFRSAGEPAFRLREGEALERALASVPIAVIATGGGTVCREENLRLMLARAHVVALSVTPEEAIKRAGANSGRPLLDASNDPLGVARRLLREREPFYSQAHVRINTAGKSAEGVAAEVATALAGKGEK